jgi:hypothetical protein
MFNVFETNMRFFLQFSISASQVGAKVISGTTEEEAKDR